ncbi:hypothetical protein F4780DRAFT_788220 [Xylariomycetidae sp. FL0641]|nr:hypothetical protein F4780DRAFT_788220 [Xylariomycetidae sp. FL0641]
MVNALGAFFIIVIVLVVIAATGWVVFTQLRARRLGLPAPPFSSYNPFARSDTAPYGSAAPSSGSGGGVGGWLKDKMSKLRGAGGGRTAGGAYEQPSAGGGGGGGRRGFGPLDPDEAWDARVGHEGPGGPGGVYGYGDYYEEQELGLRSRHDERDYDYGVPGGGGGSNNSSNPYAGGGYELHHERGRTMSRSPGVGGGGAAAAAAARNPFDDHNAADPSDLSLRGVSPRPIDTTAAASHRKHASVASHGTVGDSPTSASERRSVFRENV